MTILSIDTSSIFTYVSVSTDNTAHTESFSGESSHNEKIDVLIKEILSKHNSKLSAIVLGSGPGSFTGLRIGYAYAKGLAYAFKIPVYQYSSLLTPAYSYAEKYSDKIICVVADARRDELFITLSEITSKKVIALLEPSILTVSEINELIKKQTKEVLLINLSPSKSEEFKDVKQLDVPALSESLILMHKALTKESNPKEFDLKEISELTPHYLREVAAKTLRDRGIELRDR